jgi:hypothetical protein
LKQRIGKNEIRMSWFLRGNPRNSMVCTVELSADKVTTSREVQDHAHQLTRTRELSHPQVVSLGRVVRNPPASAKHPVRKALLLVTTPEDGEAKTRLYYDRLNLPREII